MKAIHQAEQKTNNYRSKVMTNIINVQAVEKLESYQLLKQNVDLAVKESKGVLVFTEADIDKAGFYIKKFKELDKKIESVRKDIVSPINDEVKSINNLFKSISNKFTPELDRLNKESNEVLRDVRRRQEELRIKEQKELEDAVLGFTEDAVLDEALMFNDPSVIDTIPQVEFKQEKLKTDNLTTQRSKKWKLIDIDKVNRKYMIIDEKMIDALRKAYDFEVTEQPIEGIEFYSDETIRIK